MKRSETTKKLNGIQLNPKESCVTPSIEGTVVGHTTWALNGCSNSNELDAQNV